MCAPPPLPLLPAHVSSLQSNKLKAQTGFSLCNLIVCKMQLIAAYYSAQHDPVIKSLAEKYGRARFSKISGVAP